MAPRDEFRNNGNVPQGDAQQRCHAGKAAPPSRAGQEAAFFRALMDSMPDPIYFKDANSRFLLVNKAAAVRKGAADPSDLIGKTDFDFLGREAAKKIHDDEQQIIRSGEPLVGIEEKITRPNGAVAWVVTTKLPLCDSSGAIIGTFGISRDITDRKKAEEEAAASARQLQQAQRMEAFGQLAGGIAHDFNNMLGGILGFSELILRKFGGLDPLLQQYAGTFSG